MIMLLIILLILFVILTLVNVFTMPVFKKTSHTKSGKVSILIPMRNEEKNVEGLITSVKKIQYPSIEVVILNDQSTDRTQELLNQHTKGDSRFTVISGSSLPEGWVGKVHACEQLSKKGRGDYLLFLDADVRVKPDVIHQSLHIMEKNDARLVTGFPRFPVTPFLGKLLVPLQHFFIFFHLPNLVANKTTYPAFTAAHGAFMFFERKAYEAIGGHRAVKSSLIEDIQITRELKKSGYKAILANVAPSVTCFMYDTNKEVWNGFLKNIYVGLGRSPFTAMLVSLFYLVFYFAPLLLAVAFLWTRDWTWLLPLLLVFIQTAIIDRVTKQTVLHFLLMPISSVALTVLLWSSMLRSLTQKGYEWKGRTYK
ncbi:glycosyltransferase family 2 protein [Jeotgalibacillus sp. ET6]|uniref:glycosyltransferase n=1 Tax=Jeotgalibacillus sp. ET6 TaxID=3037260 RepID=UPI0024186D61|nr:glycosyltransferase family 2 protein [Jeotgalibacillus sp. ET6]MDG5470552.1 glycosyltransferase family 2 protein [Jeotgalibacillus sp. ET6]